MIMENNQEEVKDLTAESENDAGVEENADGLVTEPNVEKGQPKVTFTKEQQKLVDELIQKRLAREKEKLSKNVESGDKNADLLNKLNELSDKVSKSERENALLKAKIPEEFREYVEFKVMKNVDEETDFNTALKEFIEKEENVKFVKDVSGQADKSKPMNMPRPKNSAGNADEKALKDQILKEMLGN